MATEKKVDTKKPTGMSVKRNNGKFTCTWKIGDKNYDDGQQCYYRTNRTKKGEWNKLTCHHNTTAKSVSLTLSDYYPFGKELEVVRFKVRGNRDTYHKGSGDDEVTYKPQWSDFTYDSFDVKPPKAPSVSVSVSEEYSNRARFSWSATDSATSKHIFTRVRWQSVLLKNSTITSGKKAFKAKRVGSLTTGTGSASGGHTITEDASRVNGTNSYTRWFRVKSQGPAGDSKWVYAKHVYARTNRVKNVKIVTNKKQSNGYKITVKWTSHSTRKRPISSIVVQYSIVTPAANVSYPNGGSWTDVMTLKYKDGSDRATFVVDEMIGTDEALFVRINTMHDQNVTPGNPVLVRVGKLDTPTFTSVTTDDNTFKATVTATNNSSVPDSRMAVYYRDSTMKPNKRIIIGIMAHSDSTIVVQAPDWSNANSKSFGVMAFVGSAKAQTRTDGVKVYSLSAYEKKKLMTSARAWSGSVPTAPTNVEVEATNTPGTVRVTWDWTWASATGAELSWADHEDAWESTDQPDTYMVDGMYASAWNISGLEVGITWYVRVRLIDESTGEAIPGPWSDVATIDLSSSPNIPALALSESVISAESSVTASWAYTTADGTPQALAEICQVADISQPDEEFVLTDDTVAVVGQSRYYIRSGSGTALDPYKYKVYVVKDYTLTTDATVQAGKNYYTRTGAGTAASPYRYNKVENPTGNPSSQGWYQTDGTSSVDPSALGLYEKNYRIIASTPTAQHIDIDAATVGWEVNEEYDLCVRVTSTSGHTTEWSDPATILIADPITCTISQTSLTTETVSTDDVDGTTESVTSLTALPLTVTVVGAGESGTTTVVVERAEACYLERPDETTFTGHEGETILIASQVGEDQMSFDVGDLIGNLDDGAKYRLIATTADGLGQSAEASIDFEVHWAHQALIPTANITIDNDKLVTFITPIAPAGAIATDTCDIYRLSVDRPELIYQGAEFGTTYVDPYPALGEMGGHRIVFRTAEGDYITQDNTLAWTDYREPDGDIIDTMYNVIDFNGSQARIMYDIELSSGWAKDFEQTKYLGGHVQGDWNPAVIRTGGVSGDLVTIEDQDMIQIMRRLADWAGICHVRTRDGSSYAADVQVSESRDMGKDVIRSEFSLSITRVDPEGFEGMSYADWWSLDESE